MHRPSAVVLALTIGLMTEAYRPSESPTPRSDGQIPSSRAAADATAPAGPAPALAQPDARSDSSAAVAARVTYRPFRHALEQLARSYRLDDALEVKLGRGSRHLLVVLSPREGVPEDGGAADVAAGRVPGLGVCVDLLDQELRILEARTTRGGVDVRTTHRGCYVGVCLPARGDPIRQRVGTDLNGDGAPEILAERSALNNGDCHHLLVLSARTSRRQGLELTLVGVAAFGELVDVAHDGRTWQLKSFDGRWRGHWGLGLPRMYDPGAFAVLAPHATGHYRFVARRT
jgi:hypothetical protein